MKKQLIAVTLVTMCITLGGPARGLAADSAPKFSDVSPDHWAYDAVARLAQDRLVEGFPGDTFGGELAFTRYEMADVVSHLVDKLDERVADGVKGIETDTKAVEIRLGEVEGKLAAIDAKLSTLAKPQPPVSQTVEGQPTDMTAIEVPIGHTRVLVVESLSRIAVADPSVADITTVNGNEILVVAKKVGRTNLVIWAAEHRMNIDVAIVPNLTGLSLALKAAFPDVPVVLLPVGESVVVTGSVANQAIKTDIEQMVKSAGYQVLNLLQVPTQANLQVEVVKGTVIQQVQVVKGSSTQ